MAKGDSKSGWLQWGLIAIAGVALYVLAVYGWWATSKANSESVGAAELLGRAFETLKGKDYILIEHQPVAPSEAIGIASMGAKLLLILIAAKGALLLFKERLRNWWWRMRVRGHTVVCGAGERGNAIARRLLEQGDKVAVVEIDPNNENLGELRILGALVVKGSARDASTLKSASIAKAKNLVAVTTKDETNLAICREASNLAPVETFAAVESFEVRSYFTDRVGAGVAGGIIRIDSFQCRAARQLMLEIANDLAKDPLVRTRGPRLLVEAADPFRDEIIRAAAVILQVSGDKKPIFDIAGAGEDDSRAFRSRFPAVDLVVDIRWHEGSSEDIFPEGCAEEPDVAVFALDKDSMTLERAERFRMRHAIPGSKVFALLQSTSDLHDVIGQSQAAQKSEPVAVRNLFGLSLGKDDPLARDIEHYAQTCHAIYYLNEKAKKPTYGEGPNDLAEEWNKLAERYRESNRLAAMHHEVKRAAWVTRGEMGDHDMLTHLSRCEHMRWMAEKAMDGWRYSEERDNDRLRHHLLTPYDALSTPEKDKDFNAFLWALDLPEEVLYKLSASEEGVRMASFAKKAAWKTGGQT